MQPLNIPKPLFFLFNKESHGAEQLIYMLY
jgi:hypothetical protein